MRFRPVPDVAAVAVLVTAAVVAGCAARPTPQQADAQAEQAIKSSFRPQGIATLARLEQDLGQAACSSPKEPDEAVAERVMAEAKATVKWPAGGRYFGDWQAGEKLAQDGSGMTWRDKSADPATNGGNCYNCHKIGPDEISHGTIGPSLYQYGKMRGVTDLASPTAQPIVEYTWMKIYNPKTYNACSNMPRFGHMNLLNEQQMRDLMSLLLDPRSPVNR